MMLALTFDENEICLKSVEQYMRSRARYVGVMAYRRGVINMMCVTELFVSKSTWVGRKNENKIMNGSCRYRAKRLKWDARAVVDDPFLLLIS